MDIHSLIMLCCFLFPCTTDWCENIFWLKEKLVCLVKVVRNVLEQCEASLESIGTVPFFTQGAFEAVCFPVSRSASSISRIDPVCLFLN